MKRAVLPLFLSITAGLTALANVHAAPLEPDACAKLKVERDGLEQAGVRGNMTKGPQWAKANLAADKLEQIRRLVELEGQLLFRCSGQRLIELPAGVEADPAAAAPVPDDGTEGKDAPKADAAPGADKKAAADIKAPAAKTPPAEKASPAKAKAQDKAKPEDAAKTKAPAQKNAPAKRAPEKAGEAGADPPAKAAAAKPKAKAKAEDAYMAPPPADPDANPFAKPPQ